ncbi:fasciclin-1 [Ctenocephalides felis]|uniref:fasciclin-1 n=1 Tax=Ctenocephalides felis TaxID=7515 RepID=UPI000E6E5769|nr:fasciclin-1 [Ctenocephalides felis]
MSPESRFSIIVGLIFVVPVVIAARTISVEEKIRDDSDLSQFYALLESNTFMNHTIGYRKMTLFAPTNVAFQRYRGPLNNSLVTYHATNVARVLDELPNSVLSESDGNPPLWVTRKRGTHSDELYINNAKILKRRSDYVAPTKNGENKQVLHVIDEVLEPIQLANPNIQNYNPDAFEFLNQSENYNIGHHRVRTFRQRMLHTRRQHVFSADGRHTFFIPVEDGFKPTMRSNLIDAKVIDGHVVPNQVLFTKPTPNDPYQTYAFGDNLQVTVSMHTVDDGKTTKTYVRSNTLIGDPNHATGVVLAEVVKANIPVRNGVVHLINRPLMVVDTTVKEFLEGFDREDGPLFEFYQVIMDAGGDFMELLVRTKDLTLFAPNNAAWRSQASVNVIRNKEKLREILNMHLVRERLPMDKILQNNINQVSTVADRRSLFFNILNNGLNQTLTVEGAGVNATVVQPNVACTNGIIHIIDRVLGVPHTTVMQKLQTDPMLNSTYFLGKLSKFNPQLNDTKRRFTYFVPRDKAWQKAELEYPSQHKKLFMKDFAYHTRGILERHLVIADKAYTMSDLKLMGNDTIVLPTLRDSLHLKVKEIGKNYYIEWKNERIPVFRPDVECTNGIIHVIDRPLLLEGDVRVTGAASSIMFCTQSIVFILLAKLLLA